MPLPTARDYKKVYDGDRGPNTGGMGAHSPAGVLNAETASQVLQGHPLADFRGLQAEGRGFRGVLYAGLMVTESGPKVLEYNARFGDPETEVILPRVTSDMAEVLLAAATRGPRAVPAARGQERGLRGRRARGERIPGQLRARQADPGLADAARMPGVELFHAGTARDGDRLVTAGGRVLVVTATAPSMTEAAMRAYEAADRIQFEGKHIRRDIAAGGVRPSRI